ncbi:hypothetical protein FT663_05388 [Candidozyma haemuli var. vulneris]|nr:hypothetical protein FT663_05388 [[Candida] haemuloni var. vulneris]KAF3986025.1 hypothetical protein FT662_04816 [[Candida] haemuloni var. vulneris]
MPKRGYEDRDYGPTSPSNTLEADSNEQTTSVDDTVMRPIVRMIVTRESRNLKTRKEHVSMALKEHGKGASLRTKEPLIDAELRDIFGLSVLFEKSSLEINSNLDHRSRFLLQKLLHSDSDGYPPSIVRNRLSNLYFLPQSKKSEGTLDSLAYVHGGLTMMVICTIIVSEGNIQESTLLQTLAEFGVPSNLGLSVPNCNINVQGILHDLVRKDYLRQENVEGSDKSSINIHYGLGNKTVQCFSPVMLQEIIKSIFGMGDEWSQKIEISLKRCFSEFAT